MKHIWILLIIILKVLGVHAISKGQKESYKLTSFKDTLIIDSINFQEKNNYFFISGPVDFAEISNVNGPIASKSRHLFHKGSEQVNPYFFFEMDSKWDRIKVVPSHSYVINVETLSATELSKRIFNRNIATSIFIGIMISMFLYNLFLFISLKDISYVYYLGYLIFIALAQISLFNFDIFIFKNNHYFIDKIFHVSSGFAGVFAILFATNFLKIKSNFPKLNWVFGVFAFIYTLVVVFTLVGLKDFAHSLVQFGGLSALIIIVISFYLAKRGVQEGYYVAFSYIIMVIGGVLLSLRDLNIIEDSIIVQLTMPLGVAIQVTLLSIALADQINKLRRANISANQRVIEEIKKNEEFIRNQNTVLEDKVRKRTAELESALNNLKSTQSQLVQSEKMASLGVLTAGIAHEINNPINFVTANVVPLRENIEVLSNLLDEYKSIDRSNIQEEMARIESLEEKYELQYVLTETDELINGIEEGAKRTHSIVDGLRTFSRGDAGSNSLADINTGIKSTMSVLKSRLNGISVVNNLEPSLPKINCQIGKINQVVLNLLNNSIDALELKNGPNSALSEIEIKTYSKEDKIYVSVSDNGSGISEEDRQKIFEPFFTTKPVGQGTGLGLSISYGIMEEHDGNLVLKSEPGKGTTFTLELPIQ